MSKFIVSYSAQYNKYVVFEVTNACAYNKFYIVAAKFKKAKTTISIDGNSYDYNVQETKLKAILQFYKSKETDFNYDGKLYHRYLSRFYPEELIWVFV